MWRGLLTHLLRKGACEPHPGFVIAQSVQEVTINRIGPSRIHEHFSIRWRCPTRNASGNGPGASCCGVCEAGRTLDLNKVYSKSERPKGENARKLLNNYAK